MAEPTSAGVPPAMEVAPPVAPAAGAGEDGDTGRDIVYATYGGELELPPMMALFDTVLSEPYSVFTYRYFLHQWPELCFKACIGEKLVGAIVCKAETKKGRRQGYVAMLAVDTSLRRSGIGTKLVKLAMDKMKDTCDYIYLETEETNSGALNLYHNLGFVRTKRLRKYYLNGVDAFRLKLWFK